MTTGRTGPAATDDTATRRRRARSATTDDGRRRRSATSRDGGRRRPADAGRRAAAALAAGARRRTRPTAPGCALAGHGRGDGRGARRALRRRRRRQAPAAAGPFGGARRLRAVRGALARATSGRTSRPPSSRSCSATPSTGSGCPRCCWSRRCWRPSRRTSTSSARCSRSTRRCPRRPRRRPAPSSARSSRTWRSGSRTRTRATLTGALDRSRADQPAAPPRHRLGPHDPGQPQELPARVPHGRARAADRVRARVAVGEEGRRPLHRPVGLDGGVRRLRLGVRRGARLDAVDRHPARRLRHGGRRPHRPARRPGRRPVRHPARRRHGHQPGARVLPVADHPARRHRRRADQRPLRGRHPGRDAASGSRR